MPDAKAEEMIRAARGKLAFHRRYFDSAVFAHILVEEPGCPTVSVDRHRRLYYNPAFVRSLTIPQLTTCVMHEIGHSLRRHHERAEQLGVTQATFAIANAAMDAELNDDTRDEVEELKDLPHLPDFAIYPEKLGCEPYLPWELYYREAMSNAEFVVVMKSGGDAPDGDPNQQGDDDFGGSGSGKKVVVVHDCGSGSHGVQRPWEHGDPTQPGATEGVSDADWADVERITAEKIAEEHAKGRGTVPGAWVSWAKDLLRPKRIPWDQELAGGLRWAIAASSGLVLHSYKRPSRRSSALPEVVLPCMRRPVPFVCMIGDTSGSMGDRDLALVRGVTEDICLSMGAQVAFLATDAKVHGGVQHVRSGRDIELKGRGGTNMVAGIEYAMTKLRPRPDVLVIVTDCDTPWPATKPRGTRVIVCATSATQDLFDKIPKWARRIWVDPENTSRAR